MAEGFQFPSEIQFDGMTWRLIYAPGQSQMVMPDLSNGTVVGIDCSPVYVVGRQQPVYLTTVDVIFPAQRNEKGEIISEQRVKGFRTYASPPLNIGAVQPKDCVFYLAVKPSQRNSTSQRFFDAVIGQTQEQLDAQQNNQPDASWCDDLGKLKKPEPQHAPVDRPDNEECKVSD